MIDAHAHLNSTYTSDTVTPVLERFAKLGGKRIIDVTTCYKDFVVSQQLISRFPSVIFANLGVHPESPDGTEETWVQVQLDLDRQKNALATAKNIVGIGETGLDFSFYEKFGDLHKTVIEQQKKLFLMHVDWAKQSQLPLVIHARGKDFTDYSPYEIIFDFLRERHVTVPVYLHSFAGNADLALRATKLGYFIGVNGIVTYSNTHVLADVVEKIPAEFVLLETDSPFLVPSNLDRKELGEPRTNEPMGIFWTAKRIAKIRNITANEVLALTAANAKRLFVRML